MTPKKRRALLEEILSTGDNALELLIARWTYDDEPGSRHRNKERRDRLDEVLGTTDDNISDTRYDDVILPWYLTVYWPMHKTELALANSYHTIEDLIAEALSLGFIDQAVRMSRAWEASK